MTPIRLQKKLVLLIIFFIAIVKLGMAQENCKVLLKAIADQYEGECKKGVAEGEGTARGVDTYVGKFRKGLPHGTGKYTSANGDVYEGEFKKGQRDGQGKLVSAPGGTSVTTTGYWNEDEYIGQYPTPYKVYYRSAAVLSTNLSKMEKKDDERPTLSIEILHKGRNVRPPDFSFTESVGMVGNRFTSGMDTNIVVAKFPLRFIIGYMGETVDIEIYQEASWKIRLDFNKQ